MEKVKVVIGANFGDEGKGLMTDYFCSQFPKDERVVNIRFNGGAQAGHTVVTPDGKRHVFGHFGAGSFLPNVATYLGPEFIINPILFRREYEQLMLLGIYPLVYCHPKCIITMPQDMMVNQFVETRRGEDRHGSCGVGIYETLLRHKEFANDITMDVLNNVAGRTTIDIDYYGYERLEKLTGINFTSAEKELMNNQNIRAHYDQDLQFLMNHTILVDDGYIKDHFHNAVFEGAQGLLLDQNNTAYFPHLTPSNTGINNVLPYIDEDMDVEVCYVTRPYLTRHGAGYLPDECQREQVGAKIDLTNHANEWQGSLRYGELNWHDFMTRIDNDWMKSFKKTYRSIAITHCDEASDEFVQQVFDQVTYMSYGPTRNNIKHGFCHSDNFCGNGEAKEQTEYDTDQT